MDTLKDGLVISILGMLWVFVFLIVMVFIMKIFSAVVIHLEKSVTGRSSAGHRQLAAAAAWAKAQEDRQ